MELQRKYDQSIYQISQLILKGKYKRVISIAQCLQRQGFDNNEVATLRSYGVWKVKGSRDAIEDLGKYEGPLVEFAKGQYAQSGQKWEEAHYHYSKLKVEGQAAPIDHILHSVEVSMGKEVVRPACNQKSVLLCPNLQKQCIEQLNSLSVRYNKIRDQLNQNQNQDYQFMQFLQDILEDCEALIPKYKPKKQIQAVIKQFAQHIHVTYFQ